MNRPLLLTIADCHIRNGGRFVFSSRPFVRNDLLIAVDNLCSLIETLKPRGIVIAGDFFHGKHISSEDLDLALKILSTCRKNCDEIFYVQGQHDLCEPNFISVLDKNAVHLHNLEFKFYGKTIRGLDYSMTPMNSILETPAADIFVTHQTWKVNPKDIFGNILLSELSKNFELTISGDIHTHSLYRVDASKIEKIAISKRLKLEAIGGESRYKFKKTFISPGPLCIQRLDAKETCGAFIVWNDLSVQSIEIPTRVVTIQKFYSEEMVRNFIEKELPELLNKALLLPEDIRPIIVVAKCIEPFPAIYELSQLLEGKGFVFYSFDQIKRSNPDNIPENYTVSQIIQSVLESNIYKEYVVRLFEAAKINRLEEELETVMNEIGEKEKLNVRDIFSGP